MRIFNLEINWSPKTSAGSTVWHRPSVGPRQLGMMTPNQLRQELFVLHNHLRKTDGHGAIRSDEQDLHQRIFLCRDQHRFNATAKTDRVYRREVKSGRSIPKAV